jgi:hypothetical protein
LAPSGQVASENSVATSAAATIDSTSPRDETPSPAAGTRTEDAAAASQSGSARIPEDRDASANHGEAYAEESGESHAAEKTGWLSVTTEPAAEVYIDGNYIGDTPRHRLELARGRHTLECRSPNHEPYVETLNISTGELSSRNIIMTTLAGQISLSTNEGAEVYLDGVFLGPTPLKEPIEVEAGRHQLTVKKAGYHVWNNSVVVDARQTLTLKITLSTIY